MHQVLREFKEFAIKGNAIELAVGIIIGAAFNQVVNSLVKDIFNPLLSILTGRVDFNALSFSILGNNVSYGAFLSALINFFLVAWAVFFLVKQINRFRRKPADAPHTKECPFCVSAIPTKATRCPHCTSDLSK